MPLVNINIIFKEDTKQTRYHVDEHYTTIWTQYDDGQLWYLLSVSVEKLNWWKGKPSGSIACTRKQQPRFYWNCSSVVMNDATPMTPPSRIPFSNVNNIHVHSMIPEDRKNMTTQWCSTGRLFTPPARRWPKQCVTKQKHDTLLFI